MLKNRNAADVDFLVIGITKAEAVFTERVEAAHVDGAYHSEENQKYCEARKIELHLHAMHGGTGRYELETTDGKLTVRGTISNQEVETTEIKTKKGEVRRRIRTETGLRYFTEKRC